MEVKRKIKRVYQGKVEGRPHWEYVEVPTYHYSEEEKMQIVSIYVKDHIPASRIVEEYHLSGKQVLYNWMDKYLHEEETLSLCTTSTPEVMSKESQEERIKVLEMENKRLQQALELEKLRSKAFDTMIDVAEETFNIPIRKKSGTKQ